jgi:phage/plasmid-like protein (TIGR03299 family)
MAHLIETMAYTGEVPWHGLGEKVPNDLSPTQMLEKAGLDWEVHKVPAFVELGGKKVATGTEALVRDNDMSILTMVSDSWNPVQNSEAFEFFNDFVHAGDMEMHTAGSLKNGKVVWALAKVKESFDLFKGDQVDSYLLFTNPHQFGKSIDIRFTPIRVVCNNTLTLSLNQKAEMQFNMSHRNVFDANQAKLALGIAKDKLDQYKEMAQFLGTRFYKSDSLINYFNSVFPMTSNAKGDEAKISKNAKACLEVMESQPGANFARGSWWQAFNAVTYLCDHHLGRDQDTRVYNSWYGTTRDKKIKALENAVEFAEVA